MPDWTFRGEFVARSQNSAVTLAHFSDELGGRCSGLHDERGRSSSFV